MKNDASVVKEREPLADRVMRELEKDPGAMTSLLARQFNVPEAEILKILPDDKCVELDASRWKDLVRSFEGMGKLFVLVSSGAAVLETDGEFGGFSEAMGYLNVQTDSLDMHIRQSQIKHVFALIKPSHFNTVTTYSFQFYDPKGNSGFKVFLNFGDGANESRTQRFLEMRDEFRLKS